MPTNPHPSLPEAWQQAERQLDAGFPDAAAQRYRQLLEDPQLAPAAHLRLSLIASDQGRYREAVDEAMSGFRTRRPEPELLQALARRRPGSRHRAGVRPVARPREGGGEDW